MKYTSWLLEEINHIAYLTINRPAALNSLTSETLLELKQICETHLQDEAIWGIVLQGAGGNFSAGVDISLIKPLINTPQDLFKAELRRLQACIDAFEDLPQPKIAKIEGYCIGGGLILAACCDLRVAEEKAVFSLPEIRMGIAVIMGTQRITRLAGIAATKEMILLADKFNASKAEDYGLLHKVVSPAQLRRQVEEWVDRFRELPPRTLQIAKQIIDDGQQLSLLESQALEAELQASLSGSYDWAEAVHSHFEKRKPNFKGK